MPHRTSDLQDALGDRYEVDREVGRGGMATVYLARDRRHERQVAVKVLDAELAASVGAERFTREIKTVAQLQHPHILPLYESGERDGMLFYVMPYIAGDSLRARLQMQGRLPVDEAVRLAREVASALDFAHRNGVVHRDVKPENILLHDGHAVVADFGIARAVSTAATPLTGTGFALGTAAYMSPEQAAGDSNVDGRSDLYALGCVLYEMLAGEPPFTGGTAQAIIARRFMAPPPSVRRCRGDVPETLDRVILKTLSLEPQNRYATAAELSAALRLHGVADAASPPEPGLRCGSPNIQACALYRDARRLIERREAMRLPEAVALLRQASVLDAEFAAARAWEAIACVMRADLDVPVVEACDAATELAVGALRLDGDSVDAYTALGGAHLFMWRWTDAERALSRAAALDPSAVLPLHWLAMAFVAANRLEEARALLDRALAIAPASAHLHAASGAAAYYARDFGAALGALRTALAIEPTAPATHVLLGCCLAAQGSTADALAAFQRSVDLAGAMHPFALTARACTLALNGRRNDALYLQQELTALGRRAAVSPFLLAAVGAALGEVARALDCLDAAMERRDSWLLSLAAHPWMDPLRREDRFQKLAAHMRPTGD